MSGTDQKLDSCHCCAGVQRLTPAEHVNRPGLSALAYRVGAHASFAATMQARIGAMPALGALGTRDAADFTIALMDAWATVADVLSFYTERIANEGYLRTATESLSIQELARGIGYEPHPGVAASTWLAFTVEDGPGAAETVPIPAGTRALSSPDGDDLPQTFETAEELLAHPEWNALRPRQTEPQLFSQSTRDFYFEGINTGLNVGDWMLLRAGENEDPEDPGAIRNIPLQVVTVEPDVGKQHTRVELVHRPATTSGSFAPPVAAVPEGVPPQPPPSIVSFELAPVTPSPPPQTFGFAATEAPPPVVFTEPLALSAANAATLATAFEWSADDTKLFAVMQFVPTETFAKYVNKTSVGPKSTTDTGVFAMRKETAPFGHNAPLWRTLPFEWRIDPVDEINDAPFPNNWDQSSPRWPVNTSSSGINQPYKSIYGDSDQENEIVLLDAEFPEVLPGSWVVLTGSGAAGTTATFRVTKAEQISRSDFAMNAEVTALTLEVADDDQPGIGQFFLRTTSIHAQSEVLALAGKPIAESVEGDTVELDHMLESEIVAGQRIILSGTPTGLKDLVESELLVIKKAVHVAGHTRLTFEQPPRQAYQRDSVRLNANLAPASHGESRKEILGGGDASQVFQTFRLSHAPLTYIAAPVPGGAQSTLEIRVNDMRWDEAAHFYGLGPDDRRYVLARSESGHSRVSFGDGHTGERLLTGFENVSASYRSGLGLAGNLPAGKITLLGSQPRYVQAVTNPVEARGGADPESAADTRRNAPNSVRTFGRIVSLPDFEDFARAFAGVAKAKASLLHLGEANAVHVTIAGENGASVPTDSALYRDLVDAMDRVRDPFQRLLVASYEKRFFNVVAKVRVRGGYQREIVLKAVEASLRGTFSFDWRELGQGVTLSEVVATMHRVRGVEAIDLDLLRFSHERGLPLVGKPPFMQRRLSKVLSRLLALPARRDAPGTVLPAQHLSVHRIQLLEMS